MINLSTEWRKRQRSYTFSGHSTIINHCHQMFRSLSNRSSKRRNNDLNASTNESAASTSRRNLFGHQSIKKAFSLILHRTDSTTTGHPSDDNEMHEFLQRSNSAETLNTISRSTSDTSDNSTINQPSFMPHATCPVHHKFLAWKNKFRCRHEQHHEKNNGYIVVVSPDTDPAFIPNENLDHQQTQHAQPCVQINEESFDLNQIQFSSATPLTPNSSPPPETALAPYVLNYNIRSNHDLEAQSTRSSVECGVSPADFSNIQEAPMSNMVSSTSTNSSCHEYTGIDRSMLDDIEYVRAQELDLHRIIDVEVDLCKEWAGLEQDLEDELEINLAYETTLQQNIDLKEQLKRLQEHDQIHSSWSCELCTFINQPFVDTCRDVCDMCEGPSPLKRATLTQ